MASKPENKLVRRLDNCKGELSQDLQPLHFSTLLFGSGVLFSNSLFGTAAP